MTRIKLEQDRPYKVLLVEVTPQEFEHYSDLINNVAQCEITLIQSAVEFLERVNPFDYHLIVIAQEDSGLLLLEQIKAVMSSTRVILISEQATVENAVSAIRMGAVDYLAVPFKPEAFQMAIQRGLDRKCALGVQQLVYVDDVTGLFNTRYFQTILDREIAQSLANGLSFAVLFIDVDQFKLMNDNFGHSVGTRLLNELGSQLSQYVRENDIVFRYGGDEFVAILSPCDLVTAKGIAERIRSSISMARFLEGEGLKIQLTISIGVALFPDHARTKKDIVDAADQAMYDAKRASRNSVFIARMGHTERKDSLHSGDSELK